MYVICITINYIWFCFVKFQQKQKIWLDAFLLLLLDLLASFTFGVVSRWYVCVPFIKIVSFFSSNHCDIHAKKTRADYYVFYYSDMVNIRCNCATAQAFTRESARTLPKSASRHSQLSHIELCVVWKKRRPTFFTRWKWQKKTFYHFFVSFFSLAQ